MLTPIRGPTTIGRAATARRPASGFALPEAQPAPEAGPAAPLGALSGLLGLQQQLSDAERDGAAQRRGQALMEELAGLQRGLLSGRLDPGRLARLAALAAGESGADPKLRKILEAISLRARIELARLSSNPA